MLQMFISFDGYFVLEKNEQIHPPQPSHICIHQFCVHGLKEIKKNTCHA